LFSIWSFHCHFPWNKWINESRNILLTFHVFDCLLWEIAWCMIGCSSSSFWTMGQVLHISFNYLSKSGLRIISIVRILIRWCVRCAFSLNQILSFHESNRLIHFRFSNRWTSFLVILINSDLNFRSSNNPIKRLYSFVEILFSLNYLWITCESSLNLDLMKPNNFRKESSFDCGRWFSNDIRESLSHWLEMHTTKKNRKNYHEQSQWKSRESNRPFEKAFISHVSVYFQFTCPRNPMTSEVHITCPQSSRLVRKNQVHLFQRPSMPLSTFCGAPSKILEQSEIVATCVTLNFLPTRIVIVRIWKIVHLNCT
jgi:hypothetical protein